MEKKQNISPSVDEAKLRVQLYNALSLMMLRLNRDDCRRVLSELDQYVKELDRKGSMEPKLYLLYVACAQAVFEYLYKAKQLSRFEGFDPEIRKHIEDVFITIAKEHDAD